MRLASVVLCIALAAFVVFPVSDYAAAVAGLIAVALLPVLGYRDGRWHGLVWALLVAAGVLARRVQRRGPSSSAA